jgi:3-oxoacyl-[acyl-carrier protein] reductase
VDLRLGATRALVTGGTRGIGRAVVETFLAEGAAVGYCARDAAEIEAMQEALTGSGTVRGSAVDVRDRDALRAWVEESAAELGGVDAVVANVSGYGFGQAEEDWYTSFEVDLLHAVRLVDAAMPHLERSETASITTVSSVSAREVDLLAGPYGSMKAALVHYTQGLANQLAAKGIRANTVSPGNTYFPGGVWQQIETGQPEVFACSMALNPTGRMAIPAEVGAAVVFLASPVSSFTTGTNLVVDGALTRGVQL